MAGAAAKNFRVITNDAYADAPVVRPTITASMLGDVMQLCACLTHFPAFRGYTFAIPFDPNNRECPCQIVLGHGRGDGMLDPAGLISFCYERQSEGYKWRAHYSGWVSESSVNLHSVVRMAHTAIAEREGIELGTIVVGPSKFGPCKQLSAS